MLNVEDLEEAADGLRITIRRSKTDQEGHGHVIAIPRGAIACPVAALKAWLEAAAVTEEPVLRPIVRIKILPPGLPPFRASISDVDGRPVQYGLLG